MFSQFGLPGLGRFFSAMDLERTLLEENYGFMTYVSEEGEIIFTLHYHINVFRFSTPYLSGTPDFFVLFLSYLA